MVKIAIIFNTLNINGGENIKLFNALKFKNND